MNAFAKRAATIFARPSLGVEFANWIVQKKLLRRAPTRRIREAVLGDFSGFSEYHSAANFIDDTEIEFLTQYEFGPGNIVDIGANIGVISLVLASRFKYRSVFAIEPNPSTFVSLNKNINRNDARNIRAFELAVSDTDGEVWFDANPTNRGTAAMSNGPGAYGIKVISKRMDTIAREENLNQIGFLKVDVEGFETVVFAGAAHVLQRVRPSVIYFEVCPRLAVANGFDPAAPARKLVESGYRLFRIKTGAALAPVDFSVVTSIAYANLVALPE
jgi:FkbM family methyltransferase